MRLKMILASQIAKLLECGVTDFLSGMAEGIDQTCAGLVPHKREKSPALKLHCILPCMGQDAKWSASARGAVGRSAGPCNPRRTDPAGFEYCKNIIDIF